MSTAFGRAAEDPRSHVETCMYARHTWRYFCLRSAEQWHTRKKTSCKMYLGYTFSRDVHQYEMKFFTLSLRMMHGSFWVLFRALLKKQRKNTLEVSFCSHQRVACSLSLCLASLPRLTVGVSAVGRWYFSCDGSLRSLFRSPSDHFAFLAAAHKVCHGPYFAGYFCTTSNWQQNFPFSKLRTCPSAHIDLNYLSAVLIRTGTAVEPYSQFWMSLSHGKNSAHTTANAGVWNVKRLPMCIEKLYL